MKFKRVHTFPLLKLAAFFALLVIGNSYLTNSQDRSSSETIVNSGTYNETSIPAEEKPNDVSPKKGTTNHATVWLIATDFVNAFSKNINQNRHQTPGIADFCPVVNPSPKLLSSQTCSQVHTNLGQLFTLVGERPSGTS